METRNEWNRLARQVAAERIADHREPIRLTLQDRSLGGGLRSLVSGFVDVVLAVPRVLSRMLTIEMKSYSYCTMNPSEC